jgi:LL-diaminopimelate aminotransferase
MTAEGHHVLRLDIGNPDLPPPDTVVDKLHQSAQDPTHHGYSGYRGIPEFRAAVARYYDRRFGIQLNPETEVLPLLGSKEGIVNLAMAYLDRGDIALVPDIAYPAYAMGARLANAEPAFYRMDPAHGYLPDLQSVPPATLTAAKLLWVNYPNNPTGATAETNDYADMVTFCREHDLLLASDNPYVEITYDGYTAGSALQAPDARSCTVEFMSLSKSYNMAGWRLGAAVGNADALKLLLQVKSNIDSGHFQPIYEAGIVALDDTTPEWLAQRNARYVSRRDRILNALPNIGLEATQTHASIYVWARVKEGDSTRYTDEALRDAHISIAPGSAYGPGGHDYVRISLGIPDESLDEALQRLTNWYSKR